MKYIFLSGGLGNQMFQYAFFLSCKKKGISVILNRDLYEVNRMHNGYMLKLAFGVGDEELVKTSRFSVLQTRLLRRYHPLGLVYSDKPMVYDESAFNTRAKYLDGCFINSHYFDGIHQDVRKAFDFKGIDGTNLEWMIRMHHCNSVSLHIRRGDYLKNSIYGVCDERYYEKAIAAIKSMVDTPKFYVFSDDTEWCDGFMKKHDVDFQIICHNTGRDSYKDMYLMTRCKHNIIANSTFSWWGAWLNDNEGKIVIAPSKWIKTIPMDKPQGGWHMIEV
jgi:hypothetical protein